MGQLRADLIVNNLVVVEGRLGPVARNHLRGCLRTAGLPLGLTLNFGDRVETYRVERWPSVARVAEGRPYGPDATV